MDKGSAPDAEAAGVQKVIRDGKVAVLVSGGFGAGWSTWADESEAAVFAPDVVAWVEGGKVGSVDQFKHYGYMGGLRDVRIEWVNVGDRFYIEEYDGSESLHVVGPDFGFVA
jgi:hypothetical protein